MTRYLQDLMLYFLNTICSIRRFWQKIKGQERKERVTRELNVWVRWRSLNLLQNRTWAQGAPGGQNAYSLRPSKLTRKDASQEIWELVRKRLAYSWTKNVVQYISVYSAAKSYSSVSLFRNTRRKSSAEEWNVVHTPEAYVTWILITTGLWKKKIRETVTLILTQVFQCRCESQATQNQMMHSWFVWRCYTCGLSDHF